MDDEWRPITEAPNYLINKHGHMKNSRGHFVGVWFTLRGEVRVRLSVRGKGPVTFNVDELVENAFPEGDG